MSCQTKLGFINGSATSQLYALGMLLNLSEPGFLISVMRIMPKLIGFVEGTRKGCM